MAIVPMTSCRENKFITEFDNIRIIGKCSFKNIIIMLAPCNRTLPDPLEGVSAALVTVF